MVRPSTEHAVKCWHPAVACTTFSCIVQGMTAVIRHVLIVVFSVSLISSCSHPFIYFPTFYTVKSLVEQQPHPFEHAYNKWRNEIWDSCKALWTLWVPCQIINFAFVPRHFRVPFGKSPVLGCEGTESVVLFSRVEAKHACVLLYMPACHSQRFHQCLYNCMHSTFLLCIAVPR